MHLYASVLRIKINSRRNKNNTIHYGPGWGSFLPLQFPLLGRDHAGLRLALTNAQKGKIYTINSLGIHIKSVFICANNNNST
jgi:hypothetical protein